MTGIADMRNLGEKSAAMLAAAGITTVEQLEQLGAVEAYLMVKQAGVSVSLNLLYAIEGALTDTHWNQLGQGRRESLLLALDARESGDFSEDSA